MSETTDQNAEVAAAMETARQCSEAMSTAFISWANSQPNGSVPLAGAAIGMAKVAGMIAHQITEDGPRNMAMVGVITTLLVNCNCDDQAVLEKVVHALNTYALATVEEAGHA